MAVRNALKVVGAALVVILLCSPVIFWPADEGRTAGTELAQATLTVPPTVLFTTTLPPDQTTTTTTEVSGSPTSTTTSITTTTTEAGIAITIAAVGDVLPHQSIVDSVQDPATDSYDFRPVFAPVASYLSRADYAVANLETRLTGPDNGYTGYPLFNSPLSLAYALKMYGLDLVATANNHALDQGGDGLTTTLEQLDRIGLAHVGTYRSARERATPFIADIQGVRVAFLNYADWLNGLSPPEGQEHYAVTTLEVDSVARDAAIARMWGADIVIALIHWGDEYERTPNEMQLEIAEEILSRGVDVILGSHPHVIQPIEHVLEYENWRMKDKYVVYSLGNFISAQRERYRDSGLIAYVHIEKRGLRARVTGISYLPVYVQHSTEQPVARYRVLPVLPGSRIDTDIALTREDQERMAAVWDEVRDMLYRPDEDIAPLVPADLDR
ncbi:MAG: CapA family protein [Thermoleophilia bacterium]|nr:CapA family protein [Thermoleophilia bacterium]